MRNERKGVALLAGVISGSLMVAGCRGVTRALLARLDGLDEVATGPIQAGVAGLAADQPIVRRSKVLEVPPEQGAPPLALLPADRREAAAQAAIRVPPEGRAMAAPLGPLTAVASGPGVVVAEPVARQADAAAREFGAGGGRWLQFVVGGHGELGKTPLWSDLDRARRELGRPDLRLNRPEAMKLARVLGVTHVAISEIQGTPSHCTLTYRLLKVPEGQEVGAPLVSTGTAEQVEAGLPPLARSLTSRLGVASPRVPPRVDASVAELRALGRLPWLPGSAISLALRRRLERTAERLPLAGLLYLNSDWMYEEGRLHQTVERLLRQAPDHPLVLGEIAAVADLELVWHPYELERCRRRFPNHQLLVLAALFRQRLLGDPPQERRLARHLICCAPGNPRAWLVLGGTLASEADRIRRGRYYQHLGPDERAALRPVYHQWLIAVAQAVRRDPLYGRAWLRVATAACFAGDRKLAEMAFRRAVKQAPDDLEVYAWGLQMYQQKWLNDRSQLLQVARRAAGVRHPYAWQCQYLVQMLRSSHREEAAERVTAAFVAENRQALTQQPALAQAHYNLAAMLKPDRPIEAMREFRAVAQQRPEDAEAHDELGLLLDERHRPDAALREYRETLRLNPRHRWVHYDVGYALKAKGDLTGAQREFRAAIRLRPGYPEAHYGLGEVYFLQHRLDPAAGEYRQAAQRITPFPEAYQRLCSVLAERGRLPEAVAAGREAVRLDPGSAEAHDALASAYGISHQAEACIRESREAIRINPMDALAHEDLGDALIERGRRTEARGEWQRALQLDSGRIAQEAREMLAKYP